MRHVAFWMEVLKLQWRLLRLRMRCAFLAWRMRRLLIGTTRARDAVEHDGVGIPVWPGEGGR